VTFVGSGVGQVVMRNLSLFPPHGNGPNPLVLVTAGFIAPSKGTTLPSALVKR
jgi:hypothetical protein